MSSDFFKYEPEEDVDVEEMEDAFEVLLTLCCDELELDEDNDLDELDDAADFLPLLDRSCFLPMLSLCSTSEEVKSDLDRLSISK